MYIMLDIRSTGMNGISFAHELLDTEKIAVMPGESFGEAASGHVRISLTLDDEKFKKPFEPFVISLIIFRRFQIKKIGFDTIKTRSNIYILNFNYSLLADQLSNQFYSRKEIRNFNSSSLWSIRTMNRVFSNALCKLSPYSSWSRICWVCRTHNFSIL